MDGAADVAETTYIPFQSEPDAAPVRLIVRRVKPTPGSQLALFASYSYHGFITDRDGETLALEADHRRHAEIENAIRDLKYGVGLNHLPSGRFATNPELAEGRVAGRPSAGPQPGPLDCAHRSGRAGGDHQDPPAAVLLPRRTAHPLGAPAHFAPSPALALGGPVQPRPGTDASGSTSCLTGTPVPEPSNGQPNIPANSRPPGLRETLAVSYPAISLATATAGRHRRPQQRLQTSCKPPAYPNPSPDHRTCNSLTPFHCPRAVDRWIRV